MRDYACRCFKRTFSDAGSIPATSTLRLNLTIEASKWHGHALKKIFVLVAKSVPNVAHWAKWDYTLFVYYSYLLRLSDQTYYTGFSENLKQRISEHQTGKVSHTKNLRPLTLVYYSAFISKKKALDFEKYLKTYSGFAFRNKRLV